VVIDNICRIAGALGVEPADICRGMESSRAFEAEGVTVNLPKR
jgi:hypothetical protein